MTRSWSYYNPTRLHFGDESLGHLGSLTDELADGAPVAVFTGKTAAVKYGHTQEILRLLGSDRRVVLFDGVEPEPTHDTADEGRRFVERHGARVIVALGGGSVLDVAKVVGILAGTDLDVERVMDREVEARARAVAVIAIPTTAGSGSEVTPFAVLTHPLRDAKQSLPSPLLYPDVAIVAPRFLATAPAKVIGDSGMDALAHAFEALWSVRSNPASDVLAFRAIRLVRDCLLAYYRDPENRQAAGAMAMAATLAGKAFSNTHTAACHGLSYPIGKQFRLSHGASCAMTLHLIAGFNRKSVHRKFADLGACLQIDPEGIPDMIAELRSELTTIPTFRDLGATRAHFVAIADGAFLPLMNNNPVQLDRDTVVELLMQELDA